MENEYAILELQKNNLQKLSEKDLLFLIKSYATERDDYENIANLVRGDESIIGKMMDSDRVLNNALKSTEHILEISPFFLFSLLLRKVFNEKSEDNKFVKMTINALNKSGSTNYWNERKVQNLLKDSNVINYTANILAKFTKSSKLFKILERGNISYQYIVDLIADSLRADYNNRFYIYSHIGDYTLYLTAMIPECVEYRYGHRRRPIDRHYYIDFGMTYYSLASDHDIAMENNLSGTLSQLSEGFEIITHILHFMNWKYIYPMYSESKEQHSDSVVLNEN